MYQAFAEDSALSRVALLACSVMQPLLLQKPHQQSCAKDHSVHLLRKLNLWSKGSFDALLKERRCIQDYLRHSLPSRRKPDDKSRLSDHLMSEGKVSMALRLLSTDYKCEVLSLDSMIPSGKGSSGEPILHTARDFLSEKHPTGRPANPSTLPTRLLSMIQYSLNVLLVRLLSGYYSIPMEQQAHLGLMPMPGDICVLHSRKLLLHYVRPWPLFLVIFVYLW